jgi:hypothetical protein
MTRGRIVWLPLLLVACGGEEREPSGTVTVLATDVYRPRGLAVGGGQIYWSEDMTRVATMPVSGGEIATLAPNPGLIDQVAVNGSHLVWAGPAGVRAIALPDGEPFDISAAGPAAPGRFVLEASSVTYPRGEAIMRAPLDGGGPESLTTVVGADLNSVAAHGDDLYFTRCVWPHLFRVPREGGEAVAVATDERCSGYATSTGVALYTATSLGDQEFAISRWNEDGTEVELVDFSRGYGQVSFVIDDDYIYFGDYDTLSRVPINGGESEWLILLDQVNALAMDDTHVYWATVGDTAEIGRIAK